MSEPVTAATGGATGGAAPSGAGGRPPGDTGARPHPDGSPSLTFRGGGWLILLTVVAIAALLLWALAGVLRGERPIGDGRNLATYGFALEPLLADRAYLVASGNPRDFLRSMDMPRSILGSQMLEYNESQRRKYVVTTDRVAGVVVNGEARAYPLAVLNAHEVVNDVVGGVPIAVSYSPLTDSLVVFDRRVQGQPRMFRVSGLLYNSNLVMYEVPESTEGAVRAGGEAGVTGTAAGADSVPAYTPSLWSQLGMRAIAGPAAAVGAALAPLPDANIASWKQWLAMHPDTTIVLPDPAEKQRYKEFSYARYLLTPRVDFPARNLPAGDPEHTSVASMLDAHAHGREPTRKTPVVVVTAAGETAVWPLPHLLAQTGGQDGTWNTTLGGVPLVVTTQRTPLAVTVHAANGAPVTVVPQLWFARRAFE